MPRFLRSGLLGAEVASDLVDLDDDILGDSRLNRPAIDHLCEADVLVVGLRDRDLAEYLVFAGDNDADEITLVERLFLC